MENYRFVYVVEEGKEKHSGYSGFVVRINETTGELFNLSNPGDKDIFSRIHKILGGTYVSDEGYELREIEENTARYISLDQRGDHPWLKFILGIGKRVREERGGLEKNLGKK